MSIQTETALAGYQNLEYPDTETAERKRDEKKEAADKIFEAIETAERNKQDADIGVVKANSALGTL